MFNNLGDFVTPSRGFHGLYVKILRNYRFFVLQLIVRMFEMVTHFVFLDILVLIDSYI